MRVFLYWLLFFAEVGVASGQSIDRVTIQGVVLDSATQQPLRQATVSLQPLADSSRVTRQLAGLQGQFLFQNVDRQTYQLVVSYLGYQTYHQLLTGVDGPSRIDVGSIKLSQKPVLLNEVNVQRRLSVSVKNDTLEFNASAYDPKQNTVVEDLLKKMPGMAIAPDGSIRVVGQVISQILVDGKPFFGSDIRMATRNLPADLIDKVQLFDKRSDQSTFSGVDDGSRVKTINLITKPQGKKGLFGQQAVGYGTDNRHQIGGGVHRFSPKRQVSILGQVNNINQLGYSIPASSNGQADDPGTNLSSGLVTGITVAKGLGANYSNEWGKSTKLMSSYILADAITLTQQTARRQTQIPHSSATVDSTLTSTLLISENQNSSALGNRSHLVNLRLEHQIDSLNVLTFTPSISFFKINSDNAIDARTSSSQTGPINRTQIDNKSVGTNFLLSNALVWMHRFNRINRTLSINYTANLTKTNTNGINHSLVNYYSSIPLNDLSYQSSQQRVATLDNQVNLSYTEPITDKQSLEFRYQIVANRSSSNRFVTDNNPLTGLFDQPNSSLSNQYQSNTIAHRVGTYWQIRYPHYTYLFNLDWQQTTLITSMPFGIRSLKRNYVSWLPQLLIQPQLGPNKYFQAHYQTSLVMPSVLQLQPVTDVTNPLFRQMGNPNLRPEYTHLLTLAYNNFHVATFSSVYAYMNIGLTQNRIVTATSVDENGVQTSQPINRNGYWIINGSVTFDRSLHSGTLENKLNWTTTLQLIRGSTYINNQLNRSISLYSSQSLGLTTLLANQLELNLTGSAAFQQVFYSISQQNKTYGLTMRVVSRFRLPLPLGLKLSTDLTFTNTTGLASGYNQQYMLWNGDISRSFFKHQQGELRIQCFDLLNQNRSVSRTITENYIEDIQGRVLSRYVLLSLRYNLKQFGSMGNN